jgi:hypothetical protein
MTGKDSTMRLSAPALALLAAVVTVPAIAADTPKLRADQCGIHTDYDVLVDSGGIWLRHGPQAPHEVVFHDGVLSLDDTIVPVSEADAARRQMEAGARQLMPAATALAHEVSGLSFDVLDGVLKPHRHRQQPQGAAPAPEAMTGSAARWARATGNRLCSAGFEANRADGRVAVRLHRPQHAVAGFTGRSGAMEARADRLDAQMEQPLEGAPAARGPSRRCARWCSRWPTPTTRWRCATKANRCGCWSAARAYGWSTAMARACMCRPGRMSGRVGMRWRLPDNCAACGRAHARPSAHHQTQPALQ